MANVQIWNINFFNNIENKYIEIWKSMENYRRAGGGNQKPEGGIIIYKMGPCLMCISVEYKVCVSPQAGGDEYK